MSSTPALSENSFEEELCQCWAELSQRKKLSISCDQRSLMDSATGNSFPGNEVSTGNSFPGHEVSTGSHYKRGSKKLNPRGSSEKMGAWGAISKPQRQHQQSSKGGIVVYPANESNFKDLVYKHTSMRLPSPTLDPTAQPSSPFTPHSFSDSSMWDMTQQTSSPTTPHSIQSSTESPLSSPQGGYPENGTSRSFLQLPAKFSFLASAHTSNPCPRPDRDSGHHTNIFQQSDVTGHMPDTDQDLNMSPRSYEKQLSLERLKLYALAMI